MRTVTASSDILQSVRLPLFSLNLKSQFFGRIVHFTSVINASVVSAASGAKSCQPGSSPKDIAQFRHAALTH